MHTSNRRICYSSFDAQMKIVQRQFVFNLCKSLFDPCTKFSFEIALEINLYHSLSTLGWRTCTANWRLFSKAAAMYRIFSNITYTRCIILLCGAVLVGCQFKILHFHLKFKLKRFFCLCFFFITSTIGIYSKNAEILAKLLMIDYDYLKMEPFEIQMLWNIFEDGKKLNSVPIDHREVRKNCTHILQRVEVKDSKVKTGQLVEFFIDKSEKVLLTFYFC